MWNRGKGIIDSHSSFLNLDLATSTKYQMAIMQN